MMGGETGLRDDRAAWEREYAKPDPLWKGPAPQVPRMDGRVLELGCGNGKTASALVRSGAIVIGLDLSRRGLLACRQAVTTENLELVEGDAAHLPFADRTMDHVVAIHVLGHLLGEDRAKAVKEIARVLRPGGTVRVRVFALDDMRWGRGREVEDDTYLRGNGIRCHFFDREELTRLFTGFDQLSMEEIRRSKRYDGADYVRSELAASFALPS